MTWGNSRGPSHWALEPRLERRLTLPQGASRAYPTIKAVAILEAMASALRPLSVTELGVLLGIPKPTVHRIVRMLEGEGLLQREPGDRRFVPGARLVSLGLDIYHRCALPRASPRPSLRPNGRLPFRGGKDAEDRHDAAI